jgi:4-amino-4-deoxy-L-arabinose transferase-like glycosyltransferase
MSLTSESSSLAALAPPAVNLSARPNTVLAWLEALRRLLPRAYGARVAMGLGLFAALWLSELALSSLTPPMDNVEQLTWVRSLEWGYYKHPPLPTWLLWPVVQALGLNPASSYLMGAGVTLAALGLFTLLLVQARGQAYASIALLAALCITYYNGRLHFYNHNTLLMLFVAASALACWQALRQRSLGWWCVLGLMLGLGGLSKYQIAVSALSVAVVWLQQRGWRDSIHRTGAMLAALTAMLVLLPHLVWLVRHDFGPIHYAMNSSLGVGMSWSERLGSVLNWLADQLLNRMLPAWLLLGFAIGSWQRRSSIAPARSAALEPIGAPADLARTLLLSFGLVPLVFMAAVGLVFGSELQLQWGTAFLPFAVPAVMELLAMQKKVPRLHVRRAAVAFAGIQILLLGLNWSTSAKGPQQWQRAHWCHFPSAQLAQILADPVRQALEGQPVRIIDGPATLAGTLALQWPERPVVLIDGDASISPWVSASALRHCPILQVRQSEEELDSTWSSVAAPFETIQWRVLPPDDATEPCS